ncbi:hypothetical protein [Mucilaginibacter rubeus]
MYGQRFHRGEALALLEHHELHHRSQITVIMELADLQIPALYGQTARLY